VHCDQPVSTLITSIRLILIPIYSYNFPVNWVDSAVSEPIHGIPSVDFRSSFDDGTMNKDNASMKITKNVLLCPVHILLERSKSEAAVAPPVQHRVIASLLPMDILLVNMW